MSEAPCPMVVGNASGTMRTPSRMSSFACMHGCHMGGGPPLMPSPCPPLQLDMSSLKKDPRVRERYRLDREPGQPTELEGFYSRISAYFRPKDDKDW